jgi:oxygen-independent coproporphyrinogen III oxidase
MTELRTTWGCDVAALEAQFGGPALARVQELVGPWERSGHLLRREGHWFLSRSGRFLADRIASDLFLVDEDAELVAGAGVSSGAPPPRERIAWWSRE